MRCNEVYTCGCRHPRRKPWDNVLRAGHMAIRAFLSFVQEDLNLINLFRAQAKNRQLDLEFEDYSIKQPFDSRNADYIGRGIVQQIRRATLTVCLYGPTTYKSAWVTWELNKTLEMGKPIMGVRLYDDGRVKYYPGPLKGWPRSSWNITQIVETMKRLASLYRGTK
jgi:Thoeris protein ThsB, TIR-like domain